MPYTTDWKKIENPWIHDRPPVGSGRPCETPEVWYRVWESSDEAHEDHQYTCRTCGKTWWVDGVDS